MSKRQGEFLLRAPSIFLVSLVLLPGIRAADRGTGRDRYGDPLPQGALMRFGTVRLRHVSGRILAFSPDGKTMTSAGSDDTLRVWETASGRLLRKLPGPHLDEHFLWDFVCATHGSTLVIARRIRSPFVFWNLTNGEQIRSLPWNGPELSALGLSPDEKTLAVSVSDNTIHLLDAKSGKERLAPLHHRDRGEWSQIVFSPKGDLLAASAVDGPIDLWDTAGEHLRRISTKDSTIAFSPDGQWSASVGWGRDVTLRTQATLTARHTFVLPHPDNFVWPICLSFSHDGKLLAAGGDGRPVVVWDVASRKEQYRLPVGFATTALFSPDDRVLATSGNSTIRLWDTKTGHELLPADGHGGEVTALAVSADGHIVASGSWEDYTVRIWDSATGRQTHVLAGHTDYIRDVAISPDGKTVFSGGGDGTVREWDVASGKQRRVFTLKNPIVSKKWQVFSLRLSVDGGTLAAVATALGPIDPRMDVPILRVWDVATGKELVKRSLPRAAAFPFSCLSPDAKSIAFLYAGKLNLEELASGKRRQLGADQRFQGPLAFSPDGKVLGVGLEIPRSNKRDAALFDLDRGGKIRIVGTGSEPRLGRMAFSADRRYLATVHRESFRLWELVTGREVLFRKSSDHYWSHYMGNSFVSSFALTADGRAVVTGMPDTTILLWSLAPDDAKGKTAELDEKHLERLWNDLGSDDGSQGYAAVWGLAHMPPEKALAFLRERLRPAVRIEKGRVQKLVKALDSAEFPVREKAFLELEKLGEDIYPQLRRTLDGKPSLEVRKRLEDLLSRAESLHAGDTLRGVRAVEVLERIGTSEAAQMLNTLAKGAADARLTREARASLDRLVRQSPRRAGSR